MILETKADLEIEVLRIRENRMSMDSAEADRLCRDLLPLYACDFIVVDMPTPYACGLLSGDWQHNDGQCEPSMTMPARSHRGAVAISLEKLRALHKTATAK